MNIFLLKQHNKGFKKCNNTLPPNREVNISYLDLSHAYLQAFRHAQIHNFKNILVLEDDFIISPEITNRTYIREINKFIHYINKTGGLIQLGTLPHITIKHNDFFRKSLKIDVATKALLAIPENGNVP